MQALAGGLAALGVGRGECVALMLTNRPEFHVADMAVATLGATPFSIYTTYPAGEIEYLLNDSGARVVIAEQRFLEVIGRGAAHRHRRRAPDRRRRRHLRGYAALADIEGSNPRFDIAAATAAVSPRRRADADLHLGHDRPPEGVQLTHEAVMYSTRSAEQVSSLPSARG